MKRFVVGVDEAGRGPLAGPVAVGVVKVAEDFDWDLLPGVGDSKQLSEKKREEIFAAARRLKAAGQLDYTVVMAGAKIIDRDGITTTIYRSSSKGLKRLQKRVQNTPIDWSITQWTVLLDGGLTAPEQFVNQKTIIKGDSKEKVIGLASICAKVTRDQYMRRVASQPAFAPYDFHIHKGYGTKAHRAAIAKYGLSPQHRATYCKTIEVL